MIRSAKELQRYVYRFFPQLPDNTFSVLQCGKRILILIATREGKLMQFKVYDKSWKMLNSSEQEFDKFTDAVLKAIEKAGYY